VLYGDFEGDLVKLEPKIASFDFDGTLAYMNPPIHEAIGTILSRHGYPGRSEEIAEMLSDSEVLHSRLMKRSKNWRELPLRARIDTFNLHILEELGITSDVQDLLNALDSEWFATKELYSDVPHAFEQLKKMGVRTAILAGPSSKEIKKVLGRHGLLDHIVCYSTGDVVSPEFGKLRKEDGTAYLYLLQQTSSKPNEVIHVGDNIQADYEAATELGITPILINRSGREDLKRAEQKGYSVVHDLSQFINMIKPLQPE